METVSLHSKAVISPTLEFHGKELWGDKGPWKGAALGERFRFAVYEKAVELIVSKDVKILFQGIDQRKLERRYSLPEPPHKLAFKFLLEQIDELFESNATHGIVISDQLGSPTEHDIYRVHLRTYREEGTGGLYPRNLSRVVDTIHFVPSKHSRLVQAIDLMTFILRRKTVSRAASDREAAVLESIWSKIELRVVYNRTW